MIKADLSEPMYFEHDMSINVSYGHYYSRFSMHWHSFMEIVAPLSNDMSITLGNETYALTENQFALVPPRSLHSLTKNSTVPCLVLQFSNMLLPQLHDFIIHRQLLCCQPVIDVTDAVPFSDNPLETLIKIKGLFYSDISFKEMRMYEELLHFFIVIGEHNYQIKNSLSAQKTPQQKAYDRKFDAVTEYIKEHYTEQISLEDLAAFAGFSKYHFSRIFKEYYQMSLPEYITSLRVSRATELLENPDLSIMDVALQSGFSSLPSFNRTFKQINNCTPSQFRKMFGHFPG